LKRGRKIRQEVVLFPGCVISYRLPFIEVSIRKILEFFGIPFKENSKFSCCPDPNGIKNSNEMLFSLTAARNLAIAEQEKSDLFTPCNGCYTSLKKIKCEIEEDHHFLSKINNYLDKIDLKVQGNSQVFHMVEFFSKFKREAIRENLKYPLTGLKVALHYGCHFLRPSNKIQLDNPLEPIMFDNLIEDLGAESVNYDLKMECCGGSLERAGKPELSREIVSAKLSNMKGKKVDCIVVCCPQCYIQFDHLQQEFKKLDYEFDIPVIYYSELLCIALGIDIQELMRKHHKTAVDPLFEKIKIIQKKNEKIREYFDLNFLLKCHACGACDNDCIIAKMTDFSPSKIIGNLLNGNIEEVIKDPTIWMCLDCYLCYELCPMRVGLVEIFTILRNLAAQKGYITKGYETEFKNFSQKGIIGMLSKTSRKRVGLEYKTPDIGDLKELFNIIERENVKRDS
jgi:heterodisulfide reductase subunit B